MTLDDYRAQTIQRLRTLTDAKQTSALVSEVQLLLKSMDVSAPTRLEFWQLFRRDLEMVAQELPRLEKSRAAILREVIFAAREAIRVYETEATGKAQGGP